MQETKTLADTIATAKTAYYNGTALISDDEYDLLVEELLVLDPTNKLITEVGTEPTQEWKKAKHLFPLGSLNKLNSFSELEDWAAKYASGKEICLVEKLDGLSIGAEYHDGKLVKAILRGNAIEGEDIIANFVKMIGVQRIISDNFTGILRGEILLTNDMHAKHFTDYSNPRNAASGLSRRLDGTGCEYLSVYFYQVIGNIEFRSEIEQFEYLIKSKLLVPNYYLCNSLPKVWEHFDRYIASQRAELPYWIDGLVASNNDMVHQKAMGEIHNRPRAKIAIKFPNQFTKTKITEVRWALGNSGRITPVAWFNPINLLGSIVEKASLYNPAYIQQLNVGIGSTVLVCKAQEIIPRVEKVLTAGSKIDLPTECPTCGGEVEMIGENLQCVETDTCPAQITGRLQNWINTLNVLEWGSKLLDRLVETELVINVLDLYRLSVDDLSNLERMGQRSAQKCYDTLWAQNPITLDAFVGGLSIPMVGSNTIQLLINNGFDTLDKLLNASYNQLVAVKGLGPKKANALFEGLKRNQQMIDGLLKVGIKIKETSDEVMSNKLTGMLIAITGSTNVKRDDLVKMINENGGSFAKSVSSKCTHLVIADPDSTSIKAVNARKMGLKLLSEEQLFSLIE